MRYWPFIAAVVPCIAAPILLRLARSQEGSTELRSLIAMDRVPIHKASFGTNCTPVLMSCGSDVLVHLAPVRLQARVHFPDYSMVTAVALDSSGNYALVAGSKFVICLWDLAQGRAILNLKGHEEEITRLEFVSPVKAVSASMDGTCRTWDLRTGELLRTIYVSTERGAYRDQSVQTMGLLGSGSVLLGTLRLGIKEAEFESGELRDFGPPEGSVSAMAVSKDGMYIAVVTGIYGETLAVWSVDERRELVRLCGHKGVVNCVAISQGGRRVVSGGSDGTVRLWERATAQQLASCRVENPVAVCIHDAGNEVVIARGAGGLWKWIPDLRK